MDGSPNNPRNSKTLKFEKSLIPCSSQHEAQQLQLKIQNEKSNPISSILRKSSNPRNANKDRDCSISPSQPKKVQIETEDPRRISGMDGRERSGGRHSMLIYSPSEGQLEEDEGLPRPKTNAGTDKDLPAGIDNQAVLPRFSNAEHNIEEAES